MLVSDLIETVTPETNAAICLCGRYRLMDFLWKVLPDTGLFHNIPQLYKLLQNQKEIERIANELFHIDSEYKSDTASANEQMHRADNKRTKAIEQLKTTIKID